MKTENPQLLMKFFFKEGLVIFDKDMKAFW